MFPILQIGSLALRTPLLLTVFGFYAGISLAERRLANSSLTADQLNKLVFLGVGSGLLAARLVFALEHWAIFAAAPLSLFSLDSGLLDPWAGLMGGTLAMAIYGQRHKLSFWESLDALTPLFAVMAVFLSLAAFASGTIFGMPTSMPWGMELWGVKRHPVALYQALAATLILSVFFPQFGKGRVRGQIFLQFSFATAASLLVVESWRANSPLLPGGIRTVQVLAWFVMALCYGSLSRLAEQGH